MSSPASGYQSCLFTCEVWSETVVVVEQETVQQFTDVVRRLVGQQAAGDLVLHPLLPGGLDLLLVGADKIGNK